LLLPPERRFLVDNDTFLVLPPERLLVFDDNAFLGVILSLLLVELFFSSSFNDFNVFNDDKETERRRS